MRTSIYRVDKHNTIIFVNNDWTLFALENDATELQYKNIIGKNLTQYIYGMEVEQLYEIILTKVRTTQQPLVIPFNCDSPTMRRFMELTIAPLADEGVEFAARLLREERRRYVALLDPAHSRSDEFLAMCSWCKRVRISEEWFEIEEAVRHLRLFDSPRAPQLTHGICRVCRHLAMEKISTTPR